MNGATPIEFAGESLAIHLELIGGLAGDMFIAAMVDAIPALESLILMELAAVNQTTDTAPGFTLGESNGLRVLRFGLAHLSGEKTFRPIANPRLGHFEKNRHGDRKLGSGYLELREWIVEAPLSSATKEHSLKILELLAKAEAKVHGVAVEKVHFHEIADWDSLMDIVAAGTVAGKLPSACWSASTIPLGGGSVKTAHGQISVPAPATSELLIGYPWRDDGVKGERVTPTGAAILRYLVAPDACDGRSPNGRMLAVGYGAGVRKLSGIPNVVRAMVFRADEPRETPSLTIVDSVAVLEFEIDDMSGEELAVAAEHLRSTTGVIDVSLGSRSGKKGRPMSSFRVLAQTTSSDAVAKACFLETTTLGLRVGDVQRLTLRRCTREAKVAERGVGVKVALRPDGSETVKAEHDDVAAFENLGVRRKLRAQAEKKALCTVDETEEK